MNKPIYLAMSILYISKTLFYEFWHAYIKPKYQDKAKLCYMDTDSFVSHIKTKDFYEDIANDVKEWLTHLTMIIIDHLFKDELGGKIMIELAGLGAKAYAYLMGDNSGHKKAKGTKKWIIKRDLLFKNYKDFQSNDEIILKSQQRFKKDHHNLYTEQIHKIALSCNDDKRLQTFDKITTYPYGTNHFKVCKSVF